ncbi:MAG TPA: ABC transporter permease [Candidatus Paceibacterota bacterium]|nr:ABC transporter permease [Candidatus Paceibacterota bacterium]
MSIRHVLKTSLSGLRANKSRSFLTILGIVIGITAIILVMAIGEGAQNLILGELQGMGSKTIVVVPGKQPSGPSDIAQIFSDSLKQKDLDLLQRKENVPTLGQMMPVVFGGDTVSYEAETYRPTIFGATPLVSTIFNIYTEQGRFFSDDYVKGLANVVIIGSEVKKQLFGESDVLGQKIRIKGVNFTVIGVLPSKGQVSFFDFDKMVIVPYTTAQQYLFGIKYFHRFIIQADSDNSVERTVSDVRSTLRNSHNITDSTKDDFFVETQKDIAASLGVITTVITMLLTSVAAISLVVGGIGIMNIMLVSVTERTKEIGLRKALGATQKDILMQFLLEAVLLTGIGGLIGIALGAGLSFIVSFALTKVLAVDWAFAFPVNGALLGLGVSATIGLIFGLYPARLAARKSPIEALRYE